MRASSRRPMWYITGWKAPQLLPDEHRCAFLHERLAGFLRVLARERLADADQLEPRLRFEVDRRGGLHDGALRHPHRDWRNHSAKVLAVLGQASVPLVVIDDFADEAKAQG